MTISAKSNPNILYILSDQHAARCVGIEGDKAAITPNLDRLCEQGTRFSRAYCPSPICLPSRMSMLTGNYPHEQQCWTNDDMLGSGHPTWLTGLGAGGYFPVLVGRMHAIGPDQLHGYAERHVGDHSSNWPSVARADLGVLKGTSAPLRESIVLSGKGRSSYELKDLDATQAAIEQIEQHASLSPEKPFCISVGLMLPHPPYVADEKDFDAVADLVPMPTQPNVPADEHKWIKQWREAKGIDDVEQTDIMRARIAYYALIRSMDRQIGQILEALETSGLAENTIVIYLSDHGDHIGERGIWWKHTFFEESVRVPLVVKWPNKIEAGRVVDDPVATGALGNTILQLAGLPQLPNSTMRGFGDKLLASNSNSGSDANSINPPVFIEYCMDNGEGWTEGMAVQQRAVVEGNFKLIYYHGYSPQLFDLSTDPFELNDLASDVAYYAKRDYLLHLVLKDWDPDKIATTIDRRRIDKDLIGAWARNVEPEERHLWQLLPEQNRLDDVD